MKFFTSLFLLCVVAACTSQEEQPLQEVASEKYYGAVATAHPLATQIGSEVLKNGGNAFDAAVAVHYALAVVYPVAGNIGGGGFAIIYTADQQAAALDFRETAPHNAHRDMFLDQNGNADPQLSRNGHLAAGVPGSVAGIQALHDSLGSLPLKQLMQPAIELAANGYLLTEFGANMLNYYRDEILEINKHKPFVIHDSLWKAGDRFYAVQLAETLRRISESGSDGFYRGETAKLITDEMKRGGGLITEEDLADYSAIWRKPVTIDYCGYEVLSMPPPSSGGIALAQLLIGSESMNFSGWGHNSAKSVHHMTELMRRVYADRATHLGDSDFYPVPTQMLLDTAYLSARFTDINPEKATPSQEVKEGKADRIESFQTTHFSVIDQWGNAIALTTTVNSYFGSKVVVEGAGFFLNNEMDDFSAQPGVPNQFGLIGGEANAIAPGKRMLSSMTPTIVTENGQARWVLGTPGGSTIITNVYQVLLNLTEYEMDLARAVAARKIHAQWLPDEIVVESGALNQSDMEELQKMGHKINEINQIGRFNAVSALPEGRFAAAADTTRSGDACGTAVK